MFWDAQKSPAQAKFDAFGFTLPPKAISSRFVLQVPYRGPGTEKDLGRKDLTNDERRQDVTCPSRRQLVFVFSCRRCLLTASAASAVGWGQRHEPQWCPLVLMVFWEEFQAHHAFLIRS